MSLINLKLTWSANCLTTNSTGAGIFAMSGTKLYLPAVTLSTQDNTKLLETLKPGFKVFFLDFPLPLSTTMVGRDF